MGDATGDTSGFGARLKELREAAGLSQAALADRAGMNVFGVAKLEQGQREPSWATVLALAEALGVDCTAFAQKKAKASTTLAPESSTSEKTEKPSAKKGKGKK